MKLTNEDNYSLSIAVWLTADFYDHNRHPGKLHLSATRLLKPIKQLILGARAFSDDSIETSRDLRDNIPSHMGTALHASVERAWIHKHRDALLALGYPEDTVKKIRINPPIEDAQNPNIIPIFLEQRFEKEIDGVIIDGQPDFIGQGILEDFKSTGVYGYIKGNNDDQYIQQGSIYRWLAPHVITSDFMRIQNIFTDWSKLDALIKKKAGYPPRRIITKKLKLMALEETEAFVKQKIAAFKRYRKAPEASIPPCTPEDLWQSEPVYKYFSKPENTRAQKVCDTYAEAHEQFMKGGTTGLIKTIPGKVKRCNWCDGYVLCTQKDEYIANGSLEPNN